MIKKKKKKCYKNFELHLDLSFFSFSSFSFSSTLLRNELRNMISLKSFTSLLTNNASSSSSIQDESPLVLQIKDINTSGGQWWENDQLERERVPIVTFQFTFIAPGAVVMVIVEASVLYSSNKSHSYSQLKRTDLLIDIFSLLTQKLFPLYSSPQHDLFYSPVYTIH